MRYVTLQKDDVPLIEGYVRLRNSLRPMMAAKKVTTEETLEWLLQMTGVVVAVDNYIVVGAVAISKFGEITIFHDGSHKGLGSDLLMRGERMAKEAGFDRVWAWTLQQNTKAQNLFLRHKYEAGAFFQRKI